MNERKMLLKTSSFLSAEPSMIRPDLPENFHELDLDAETISELQKLHDSEETMTATPAVIISFGGVTGPVDDFAVSIDDARELVMQTLGSLEALGDPIARAIGDTFFRKQND